MNDITVGEWLYRLRNGAKAVIAQRAHLNAINVFPVADRDTGSNLSSLMQGLLSIKSATTYQVLAKIINRTALQTARGNSGTIMCQFLCHFTPQQASDRIVLSDWVQYFILAAKEAAKALESPAEGTVITLMSAASEILASVGQLHDDLTDLLAHCLPKIKIALNKTTHQNAALQASSVVDAGALGFYCFLEGMLKTDEIEHCEPATECKIDHKLHQLSHKPQFRYCTEILFEHCEKPHSPLRDMLSQYGDSMILAGSDLLYRLHIHTNDPAAVVKTIANQANIIEHKVDDMFIQFRLEHEPKKKLAIVTDSIADIPPQLLEKYLIHVLPVEVFIEENAFQDKLTVSNETVAAAILDNKLVQTSSPNSELVQERLTWLTQFYDAFLFVVVAKAQSGTYDRIKSIASQLSLNYAVVDSLRNASALGLLVLEAARLAERNADLDGITHAISDIRLKSNIVVAVKDIQPMINSGRLHKLSGLFIKCARIKPLITLDDTGRGVLCGKALGFNSALQKLFKFVVEKKPRAYVISYAGEKFKAKQLADKIEVALGYPPAYIMPVSSAVMVHAGAGCVAVSML
ncbi:MAG: DegV family protein [Coxiellaceae bacterium]|nr:DegV family protein [Coxiellaceae bacterium]